jgi:hypothetical protein
MPLTVLHLTLVTAVKHWWPFVFIRVKLNCSFDLNCNKFLREQIRRTVDMVKMKVCLTRNINTVKVFTFPHNDCSGCGLVHCDTV